MAIASPEIALARGDIKKAMIRSAISMGVDSPPRPSSTAMVGPTHYSDLERRFDRLTTQRDQGCQEALLGATRPRQGQGLSGVQLRGGLRSATGLAAGRRPGRRAEFS